MSYLTFQQTIERSGLSRSTIKNLIRRGQWREGIHFTRFSSRKNLFNETLITDWIANRHDPNAHQRAIDNFVAGLPSNQPKTAKIVPIHLSKRKKA